MAGIQKQDASDLSTEPTDDDTETTQGDGTSGEPKPKKVLTIPSDRVKKIKDKAFKKGQNQAKRQLDEQAQAAGFKDWNDFLASRQNAQPKNGKGAHMAAAATVTKDPETRQPPAATPTDGGPNDRSLRRQVERLTRENGRLSEAKKRESHQRGIAEKRVKELEQSIASMEAEHELQISALHAGVSPDHLDYAMSRLQKELGSKDEAALKSFDPSSYFKGLKDQHPYLFGTVTKPAETSQVKDGAGGTTEETTQPSGAVPAPPKTVPTTKPAATTEDGTPKKIDDAMVAPVEDLNASMAARGIKFRFARELPEARRKVS